MSKFKVGDHVRVTGESSAFDQPGDVECQDTTGLFGIRIDGLRWWFPATALTLADPDVHTVLDQMDAESALPQADLTPHLDRIKSAGEKCMPELPKTGITATDKLRLIADTVEGQAPFGTELANFRRRLFAILSIGHDA